MRSLYLAFLLSSLSQTLATVTSEAQTWANVRIGGMSPLRNSHTISSLLVGLLFRRRLHTCELNIPFGASIAVAEQYHAVGLLGNCF